MITTSDATKIMLMVQACHPRTAPRMDDDEVTLTIATVWAELFNAEQLEFDDLIAAVKKRARNHDDAPDPAEIIRFARETTEQRRARLDTKADPNAAPAITAAYIPGPPRKRTPRLTAAEYALQTCTDKTSAQAAIHEFFEAKREANKTP